MTFVDAQRIRRHTITKTETRERDTDTQRHRDAETQKHRDTETQRHRDTQTERESERGRDRHEIVLHASQLRGRNIHFVLNIQ